MSFNYDAIAQVARGIFNLLWKLAGPKFEGALTEVTFPITADMFSPRLSPTEVVITRQMMYHAGGTMDLRDVFISLSINLYNQMRPHGLDAEHAYARPYIYTSSEDEEYKIPEEILWRSGGAEPREPEAVAHVVLGLLSKAGYLDILFKNMQALFFKLHHTAPSFMTFNRDRLMRMRARPYVADNIVRYKGIKEKDFALGEFDFEDLECLVNAILIVHAAFVYRTIAFSHPRFSLEDVISYELSQKWVFVESLFGSEEK